MKTKLKISGAVGNANGEMHSAFLTVTMSNDEIGKTLSINDGNVQFTIPFEPVEKFMREEHSK